MKDENYLSLKPSAMIKGQEFVPGVVKKIEKKKNPSKPFFQKARRVLHGFGRVFMGHQGDTLIHGISGKGWWLLKIVDSREKKGLDDTKITKQR